MNQVKPLRPPGSAWPVRDAADTLAVSVRHVRRLIAEGKVKTIRLGTAVRIPDGEMRRLLTGGHS